MAFSKYPTYWIEDKDGSLVYGSTTPEMKQALTTLSELYADGLIDNEFYVNDNQKAAEALVNGKCGAMYGFHATPLDFLQTVVYSVPVRIWKRFSAPLYIMMWWLAGFLILPFLIGKNLKNALLYFKYIP